MSCTGQAASAMPSVVEQVVAELPSVCAWIALRVQRCEDVRDVCQDVALTALERLDTFDHRRGHVRAWLYGITLKLVARHYKRRGRLCAATGDAEEFCQLPDPSPDAEVRVEYRDLLKKLTAKIPPSRLAVFIAHRIDGLTFEQTAEVFHISAEAARKRDERAWKEFQAAWEEHQAEQRKLGAFVLPVSALAFVAAIRAYVSQVPEGVLESIRAAIEMRLRDAEAPASQERPSLHEADPVEAQALPAGDPSPWSAWLASLAAVPFVAGLLMAIFLAAVPSHDPARAHERLARVLPLPDALPTGSVAAGASPEHAATVVPTAEVDRATPYGNAAPPARSTASPSNRARAVQSMAFTLLHEARAAVNRGDVDQARSTLAAYDARYPHNPFPAARASLARRIADIAKRSSTG